MTIEFCCSTLLTSLAAYKPTLIKESLLKNCKNNVKTFIRSKHGITKIQYLFYNQHSQIQLELRIEFQKIELIYAIPISSTYLQ